MRSLLPRLRADHPEVAFAAGERYAWSPSRQTVFYDESDPGNLALLLHELSHGLLGHRTYRRDVELLGMEADAWAKARELADRYQITITDETVEDHLDTYRDWLHARSTCPSCEATGYQTGPRTYTCVACSQEWRVNEARLCALRRYATTTK